MAPIVISVGEGIPSRGTPLRFAPFRPLPLSPSSPAVAGTCIQRAPPPALVRGWTSPLEGIPSPTKNRQKNIAILLIIKGIAIAFVNLFDYICIALKQTKVDIRYGKGSL